MDEAKQAVAPDLPRQTSRVLQRRISPRHFWWWFGHAEAAIEVYGTDDDSDLASLVQLLFFEWTGRYLDDEELLRELAVELEREHPAVLRIALPPPSS